MYERQKKGLEVQREVLGNAHMDRIEAGRTKIEAPFDLLATEGAWGFLWARDTIALRDRSLITIAILAALGETEEMETHIRATRNTGATRDEIVEALLHVSVYAGQARANSALRIAKRTLAEMEVERAASSDPLWGST